MLFSLCRVLHECSHKEHLRLSPCLVSHRSPSRRKIIFLKMWQLTYFFYVQALIYGSVIALHTRASRNNASRSFALVARGSDSARWRYRIRLYGGVKITVDRVIELNCASPDKFCTGEHREKRPAISEHLRRDLYKVFLLPRGKHDRVESRIVPAASRAFSPSFFKIFYLYCRSATSPRCPANYPREEAAVPPSVTNVRDQRPTRARTVSPDIFSL